MLRFLKTRKKEKDGHRQGSKRGRVATDTIDRDDLSSIVSYDGAESTVSAGAVLTPVTAPLNILEDGSDSDGLLESPETVKTLPATGGRWSRYRNSTSGGAGGRESSPIIEREMLDGTRSAGRFSEEPIVTKKDSDPNPVDDHSVPHLELTEGRPRSNTISMTRRSATRREHEKEAGAGGLGSGRAVSFARMVDGLGAGSDDEESDGEVSEVSAQTAGGEPKRKKRGRFGLKLPRAIRHVGSKGQKREAAAKTRDSASSEFGAVDNAASVSHRRSNMLYDSGSLPLSQADSLDNLNATELREIVAENTALRQSRDELQTFLAAKNIALGEVQRLREEDEAAKNEKLEKLTLEKELIEQKYQAVQTQLEKIATVQAAAKDESPKSELKNGTDFRSLLDECQAQNQALQERARELEDQVLSTTQNSVKQSAEIRSLTSQLEQLASTKKSLEDVSAGKISEAKELREELASLTDTFEKYREAHETLMAQKDREIETLESKVKAELEEIEELNGAFKDSEKTANELSLLLAESQKSVAILEGRVDQLLASKLPTPTDNEEVTALKKNEQALLMRIQELKEQLDVRNRELTDRGRELAERGRELSERGRELASVRAELAAEQAKPKIARKPSIDHGKVAELEMAKAQLKALEATYRKELKTKADAAAEAAQNVRSLESDLESRERELREIKQELQSVRRELASEQQLGKTMTGGLKDQVRNLTASENQLRASIENIRKEHLATLAEKEKIITKLENQLKEERTKHEESMNIQRRSVNEMKLQNGTLTDQKIRQAAQHATQLNALQAQISSLETLNRSLEEAKSSLQHQLDRTLKERRDLEDQFEDLQSRLLQKEASNLPTATGKSPPLTPSAGVGGSSPDEAPPARVLASSVVVGGRVPNRVSVYQTSSATEDVVGNVSGRRIARPTAAVAVVCILKSRLLQCLFDRANPGEPMLPSKVLGQSINSDSTNGRRDGRPPIARVLSMSQSLWDLAEDLRLGLVQSDPSLSDRFRAASQVGSSEWKAALNNLRGSAEIIEKRNLELEVLCNKYLYAVKEARTSAQLEKEKSTTIFYNLKKQIQKLNQEKEELLIKGNTYQQLPMLALPSPISTPVIKHSTPPLISSSPFLVERERRRDDGQTFLSVSRRSTSPSDRIFPQKVS